MKLKYLKLIAGLLIFIGIVQLMGDFRDLKDLGKLNWGFLWLVPAWTAVIIVISAWRWHALLGQFSIRSPFMEILRAVLIGRIVGHSTSNLLGDMGSRFIYLKSMNIEMRKGSFTILLDKLLEGILLISVVAVFFGGTPEPYVPYLSVMVFFAGIYFLNHIYNVFIRLLPRSRVPENMSMDFPLKLKCTVAVLTLCKYAASALRFMAVMWISGIDLKPAKVLIGTAAAQIGLATGLTPGGIGLVEAGWAGAMHYFQVPSQSIVVFLLLQRILIFTSVAALATPALLFKHHKPKRVC